MPRTFGDLKTTVDLYTQEAQISDVSGLLDIVQTEVGRALSSRVNQQTHSVAAIPEGGRVSMPSDFRDPMRVQSDDGVTIYERVTDYNLVGNTMRFSEDLEGEAVDVIYFAWPPDFTDDSEMYDILNRHFDVYAYRAAAEAYDIANDSDNAAKYMAKYDRALERANRQEQF